MRLFARFVMPSQTRFCAALVLGSLSVGVAACGDDTAAATAEGATWKLTSLTSAVGGVQAHDPNADPLAEFKVSCRKSSSGVSVRIEDPGRATVATEGDAGLLPVRTRSVLQVNNINNGNCTVLVAEGPVQSGQLNYTGQCKSGCTVTETPAGKGFDFQGTLICASVLSNSGGTEYGLASASGGPITLNLANCN